MDLSLVDIKEKDYDFIYKLTTNKSVMRFITNGKIWSKEKIEKFVKYNLEEQELKNSLRNQFYYIIEDEKNKIGIIGFFKEENDYFFRVLIDPKFQGKGYFSKSLEMLTNILIRYKNIDKLHGEVHSNNYKMNSIMKGKYYYDGQSYRGKIRVKKYIIFLRPYTYLVKSDYYNQKAIDGFFKTRGNWKKYNPLEDKQLDYFRLDGKHYSDKKNWDYKVILKNIVNKKKQNITIKSNLSEIFNKSKFFMSTYTDKKSIEKKGEKVWIVKPDRGFSGKGIVITKNLENLKLDVKYKNWSYQEYIKNPLLIEDKKFHMRVILLYRGDRKLYYFKKIPIYLAKKNFVFDKFDDEEIHISHYNAKQSAYYLDDFEMSEKVISQLKIVLKEVKNNLKAGCFEDSKRCYEIFGADFMLTDKLELKLIEINSKVGFKEFVKDKIRFNNLLLEAELQKTADFYFPPLNKIEYKEDFIEII